MKEKIPQSLYILLLIVLITCCAANNNLNKNLNNVNKETISDVNSGYSQGPNQKRWERIYLASINERLEKTDIKPLKDIELSEDSKEIRVWAGFDTSPLRGIILKQDKLSKSAFYVLPVRDLLDSSENIQVLSSPKSGWDSLWKKLNKLEIMTLPDPMDFAQIDGESVVVEVRDSNSYKNYKYSFVGETKDDNYKKVLQICNTLTDEFGVDLYKYHP